MGSASTESGLVAKRYAAALLDMAADAKIVETIEQDLKDLQAMLESSDDLQRLVSNPLVTREQQKKAVQALSDQAKFQTLTANFLGTLADNRRLSVLSGIIGAFHNELRRRRGEVEAKVQTAFALSPAQTQKLQEELSQSMGANVTLDVEINKDLLGGMVVTVGSRMIDDSVRRKLEQLRRAMNSNSNISNTQLKEVG